MNERIQTLKDNLKKENIDHALITYPANIFYYTNFLTDPHERFLALYVDAKNDHDFFFVPSLDLDAAQAASGFNNLIPIEDTDNPIDIIKEKVPHLNGLVGIEGNAFSFNRAKAFTESFDQLQFTDIEAIVSKQRLYKTADEITALKEAIRIIEKVLEEGSKRVKVGMTEAALVAELEYLMRLYGADGPSFGTIALSGVKAALPHGVPDEKTIQEGELLLIDFGVIKDGYCSDITRTFAIGEVDQRTKDIYHIVLEANEAGIAAAKAETPLKNFDIAARDVITEKGYGKYFTTRVGHGLGIEVHEAPSIHGKNEALAETGMVFTIEPGIYIPDDIGVRIEDILYINEDGETEVLTSFPKKLQTIGV